MRDFGQLIEILQLLNKVRNALGLQKILLTKCNGVEKIGQFGRLFEFIRAIRKERVVNI